jgi:hypothetical protein
MRSMFFEPDNLPPSPARGSTVPGPRREAGPFLSLHEKTDRHIHSGQTSLPPARSGGRNDSPEVNRMPEFAHPFAGNNIARTMSQNELIRAVRYTIAAEYKPSSSISRWPAPPETNWPVSSSGRSRTRRSTCG